MNIYDPEVCHQYHLENAPLPLAFKPENDFEAWKKAAFDKLKELLGIPQSSVPLNVRIEYEREEEYYTGRRFIFTSEPFADVPCHLLIPKVGKAPFPLMICLQGHSPGMHISLGRPKNERDAASIAGGRDYALQAVREGFAALTLEQRCFGERSNQRSIKGHDYGSCHHPAMVSLLLGRTMTGERSWDVSRAIDAVELFPEIDMNKIGCFGNSTGGLISYFAAAIEPRITAAMPSCSFGPYHRLMGSKDGCQCGCVPRVLKYMEKVDIGCLIAPRPLIVVAGRYDDLSPITAVERDFNKIHQAYQMAGAPDKCRLVIGEGGHKFYPEDAWPVFKEVTGW